MKTMAVVQEITSSTCRHHWRIDEANGPTSRGRCRRCGNERDFKNWLSDGDFITNEEHRVGA